MATSKIKDNSFILIQSYMIKDLNLKGNELLVYAIIQSFTQTENQKYTGSLQYLAEWCNSTKQGIIKNLKSLQEKNLIVKNNVFSNGLKFCEYHTTKFNQAHNNVYKPTQQSLIGHTTEFNTSTQLSLSNKITNNIDNNIDNNIVNKDATDKQKFISPTLEQIQDLISLENYFVNAEKFFYYYESNGWKVGKNKMKSWQMALAKWNTNEKPKEKKENEVNQCFKDIENWEIEMLKEIHGSNFSQLF